MRRAAKVDRNQAAIVKALRQIPGVSVDPGHDDIFVGFRGRNFWFELKTPDCVSARTGRVKNSELTNSEKIRLETWRGQYDVVWSVDQILGIIENPER